MNLLTANMKKEKEQWEAAARQEGRREGRKEGESIGEKKGRKEEKISIAQRMKEKGIELKLISSITGLKIEEI